VVLNTEFPAIFNLISGGIQSSNGGQFSSGIIQLFASFIPSTNPVTIPESVWISYAMPTKDRAKIDNQRLSAYIKADVKGIDKRHHIRDVQYLKDGDLVLDPEGAPFQFMISTMVIN
jgi:hypothetical protein